MTPFFPMNIAIAEHTITLLRSSLEGDLFLPDTPGYDDALRGWNSAIKERPAVLICARSAQDVAHAVAFARENALAVSVRGGGHNSAGLGYCDNGVMIDLGQMNMITVDAERRVARAHSGVKLGAFVAATQAHGLATTTGTCSSVGLAGSTLGGGVGWLMGRYGMTIDNVLAFELVTADSRILTASASENPDLFWALRGGGGNFGVVTEITYQLHPVTLVYGGMVIYPVNQAHPALRAFVDLSASAPDELMIHAMLTFSPRMSGSMLMLHCCYCGDNLLEGERLFAPLRGCSQPIVAVLQPMPYGELFTLLDAPAPAGLHYYDTASSLHAPSDAALSAMIAAAYQLTAPLGSIVIHQMRGAAIRVPPDATAFALREHHFSVMIISFWAEGSGNVERAWANDALTALSPFASPSLYVNFMGRSDESAVRQAYRTNYVRLSALKQQYDPKNLFCNNQNILPATRGT